MRFSVLTAISVYPCFYCHIKLASATPLLFWTSFDRSYPVPISQMNPVVAGNGMASVAVRILISHSSATSISSASPSISNDSNLVPVLSRTHATRRPIRPFSATVPPSRCQSDSSRRRLTGNLVEATLE